MQKLFITFMLLFTACGYAFGNSDYDFFADVTGETYLMAMEKVPMQSGDGVTTFEAPAISPERKAPPIGFTPGESREKTPAVTAVQGETFEPQAVTGTEPVVVQGTQQPAQMPAIPPGTSFTPEQINTLMSQQKSSKPVPDSENYIILNFDNAALKDVINTVSSITGENFLISPGLDARITIHSTGKIPVKEALNIFESILELNNMAIVRSGKFYKIVAASTAKQRPIEVMKGSDAESVLPIDRIITQIIQVDYVPATEIIKVLQPMMSQVGAIIADPRTNLLIVNEYASNLKRLMGIMDEIDVNAFENNRMMFFQPKYSDISSLSEDLKEILTGLNIAQQGIVIIPIDRINSLVVFAASPSLLTTVEGWLKKLDEEVSTGQNVFVYPVQNVKAEDIVDVLKMIYGAEGGSSTPKKKTTAATPAAGQKEQKTEAPVQPVVRAAAQAQPSTGKVEITVYEPTNSLVILASPGIYRDMQDTIKKLDIYPQQVLIEAVIAQVTSSDSDKFGIQWSVLHNVHIEGDNEINGLLQNRSSDAPSYLLPLTLGTDSGTASTVAGGLSYLLFRPDKFAALIQALASKGKVNILSSPRLLVKDQEEASIEVGSDVPTATSTTSSTTTTDNLTQNIEYRTVGIKLLIKPTINDERTVVLDIEQEVSSKGDNQQVGQSGNTFPSFNTTKTKTSIIVPDKQGVVIGGLMEEFKDKNYQGVPVLSAIPILGRLFRYTTDTTTKKELIILITPHVINNKTESNNVTMEFLEKLRGVKKLLGESGALLENPLPGEINTPPTQTNEQ